MVGVRNCEYHGGRTAQRCVREKGLTYYHKYLGKKLRDKVDGFLNIPAQEQLALYEELAISRTTALHAIQLYDAAVETENQDSITIGIECVREAMNHVRDICLAASKVEKDSEDKISARSISIFVTQIIRAIHKVCPDEKLTMRIEAEIHNSVRVPKELEATNSTPSDVVVSMDETVPAYLNSE